MNRATLLVLLGGLALTLAFILAPGDPPSRPYTPASDAEVLEQVRSPAEMDGGAP